MRHLSQTWQRALGKADARVVLLVTLNVLGRDPADDANHLALQPGSLCCATHGDTFVSDSSRNMVVPFWPYLTGWPEVEWRMMRRDRRAEISETQINLGSAADFGAMLDAVGGGILLTGRVDAWTDGVELSDVIPLVAGPCTVDTRERDGGPVKVTLRDGDPEKSPAWPIEPISINEFPDAPSRTFGKGINAIIGPAPDEVVCLPIDSLPGSTHREYLYGMNLTAGPQFVLVNGAVESRWTAEDMVTPGGLRVTKVVFAEALPDDADVTASGGVGIVSADPITFLCRWAGVEMDDVTKALLAYENARPDRAFDMSVLGNVQAPVVELLRQRLIPQTPFAMTFERGRLRLLPLDSSTTEIPLSIGSGLSFRLRQQPTTEDVTIYNSFMVECGRKGDSFLMTVKRDAHNGPAAVREACAVSQQKHGLRPFTETIKAYDVNVESDGDGNPVRCPSGERLADHYALTFASEPRRIGYQVPWLYGLALERNDRVTVTDDELTDQPGYIEQVKLAATGPQIVVEV